MRNASGYTKVKMSGSEKNRVNRNTNIYSTKRVTRKLKEVLRFSLAKQRKGTVQKSVLHEQSCFFANQEKSVLHVQSCCCCFSLIRSIAAVFYRSCCFHPVFNITRFYIYIFFEETISPGQIYILSLLHNLPNKHAFKLFAYLIIILMYRFSQG